MLGTVGFRHCHLWDTTRAASFHNLPPARHGGYTNPVLILCKPPPLVHIGNCLISEFVDCKERRLS